MQSLIPNPLHPAVVHLPVALAVLLPVIAIGSLWFIRRGARVRAAWGVAVGFMAMLVASGLVAKETGEGQEERVERVVPEGSIHTHEEAADLFVAVAIGVFAVGMIGLAPGTFGVAGRWLGAVGTAAILAAGWNVGHSGGMLVYRDGAASAYAVGGTGGADGPGAIREAGEREGRRGGDDDDR